MSTVVKKKSNGVVIATVIALTVLVSLCVYVLTINSNISISDDTMVYIVIYGAIAGFALLAFVARKYKMKTILDAMEKEKGKDIWRNNDPLSFDPIWSDYPGNIYYVYKDNE